MKGYIEILVDDSEEYRAVIIYSEPLVRKIIHQKLEDILSRSIHMRELGSGEKLKVASLFSEIIRPFSRRAIFICMSKDEAYQELNNLLAGLSELDSIELTLHLDPGISEELHERCGVVLKRFKLKQYVDKARVQSADVLAWINSHKRLRLIWEKTRYLIRE